MSDFDSKTVTENLEIDEFHLDTEMKNQAVLFFKYASLAADADKQVRMLKEAVELTEAEADTRARNELQGKVTESMVKSFISQDEECILANQKYIEAIHIKNMLDAAVKAFDQRKGCLDNLVRLHLANYYSEPEETVYAKAAEQEAKQKKVRRVVRERLNKEESE